MVEESKDQHLARLEADNELLRRLLVLGHQEELEPLLREALALVVETAQVRLGYLELFDDDTRWSMAHGFGKDDIAAIREEISSGIVAEALARGETVSTLSARDDPRFSERRSVRRAHIDAVLCAPIDTESARGVLYLQGRIGHGMFSVADCERAELFAQHIGLLADRLLAEQRHQQGTDPIAEYREKLNLGNVVGRSEAFAHTLKQISLIAPLEVGVLLTGASGTGKTQLARVIHDSGPRAGRPFVELNCAALPDTLVESELFGAVAGAHSTATRPVDGKIAAADRGTLFLDEVGELSLPAQAKLLQFLHSKEYFPLGSAKAKCADVRIIAATNADLSNLVQNQRFREDLLYRLQVLPVRLPALDERREDIPVLAKYFAEESCQRHGLAHMALSRNAVRSLVCMEWPGNVRQLAHAIEAAVIRASGERAVMIEQRHVFPEADGAAEDAPQTFQEATRAFQERLIRDTLEDTGWNVLEASRRLDVARSHLYGLINAFGLQRK